VGVGVVVNRAFGSQKRLPYSAMVVGTSNAADVVRETTVPLDASRLSRILVTTLRRFCTT
jgi:hypothetical protein